jgi:hypothetical protein
LKYRRQLARYAEWLALFYQHSVPDGTIEAKEEKRKMLRFILQGFDRYACKTLHLYLLFLPYMLLLTNALNSC